MNEIFTNPNLIDAILTLVALEMILLLWQRRWRLVPVLVSGAALLLALRAALADSGGVLIGSALAVAGLAHLVDLWLRLREPRGSRKGGERPPKRAQRTSVDQRIAARSGMSERLTALSSG